MKVQIGRLAKRVFVVLLFASVIVGCSQPVRATSNSFGVSPASIYNTVLLRGSHFEQNIVISRATPNTAAVALVTIEDETLNEWITFEPGKEIQLPLNKQRVNLKAIVNIPEDADLGIYKGSARIVMKQVNAKGQVVLLPAVALSINLVVGDEDVPDLRILTVNVPDVSEGNSVIFKIKAINTGNVPAKPSKIEVEFQTVSEVHYSYFISDEFKEIDAFSEREQDVSIPEKTLSSGDYFAVVTIYGEDVEEVYTDKVAFRVLPGDGIKSVGDLFSKQLKDINPVYLYLFGGLLLFIIFFILLARKKKKEKEEEKQ